VELVAAFEARDIHREAMAALVLFRRACEEGRMTAEMVTRVAALLRGKGEAAAAPYIPTGQTKKKTPQLR
jgi:hypothetical protein